MANPELAYILMGVPHIPMAHHKIWESGRNPHKRPDKGKKKPQAIRQAKKRLKNFKKRLSQRDAFF